LIGSLLGIVSLTPLHVGVGRGLFDVDLPIARDEFMIPYIPGSGIKGALRARLRLIIDVEDDANEKERLRGLDRIFFGQLPESPEALAGSVVISDAILLAIPVRTLYGLWAYATSAFQLKRFMEYYLLAKTCHKGSPSCCCSEGCGCGSSENLEEYMRIVNKIRSIEVKETIVSSEKAVDVLKIPETNKIVMNEDIIVEVTEEKKKIEEASKLIEVVKRVFDPECGSKDVSIKILLKQIAGVLEERLVIVNDSIFKALVERSIITQTRVRLNYKTKTVEAGPWTEENLPQFTILTSLIMFARSRKYRDTESLSAEEVRKRFIEDVIERNNLLVLGGHETIGRGLVVLKIC
jgi:CRISPR-associated protein Cmr4